MMMFMNCEAVKADLLITHHVENETVLIWDFFSKIFSITWGKFLYCRSDMTLSSVRLLKAFYFQYNDVDFDAAFVFV